MRNIFKSLANAIVLGTAIFRNRLEGIRVIDKINISPTTKSYELPSNSNIISSTIDNSGNSKRFTSSYVDILETSKLDPEAKIQSLKLALGIINDDKERSLINYRLGLLHDGAEAIKYFEQVDNFSYANDDEVFLHAQAHIAKQNLLDMLTEDKMTKYPYLTKLHKNIKEVNLKESSIVTPKYSNPGIKNAADNHYLNQGVNRAMERNWKRAIFNFNKEIEKNPANLLSITWRGFMHEMLGNHEKAQEDFAYSQESINQDNQSADILDSLTRYAIRLTSGVVAYYAFNKYQQGNNHDEPPEEETIIKNQPNASIEQPQGKSIKQKRRGKKK